MAAWFSRSRSRWLLALAGVALLLGVLAPALMVSRADAEPVAKRAEAAHKVYDQVRVRFDSGQSTIDEVYTWSVHWLDAELAGASKSLRKRAFTAHQTRMTELRGAAVKLVNSGVLAAVGSAKADYYVAEAEAWLAALAR